MSLLGQPLRLLILTSSTGGGHDMRARSLRQWAERETPWQVHTHQALEATHPLYRFGVGLYNTIQRRLPAAHHAYFGCLELAAMHRKPSRILGAERFRATVRAARPDVIVSTHAHLNHGFFDLAREALPTPPACITYCGELSGGYGFSRHWVNPGADAFIAAVDTTRHAAVGLGMRDERAVTGGFLLDPRFHDAVDSGRTRANFLGDDLGLDPARFTLLLSTGAVGANNHARVLERLRARPDAPQVIALCGDDSELPARLQAIAARHADLPLRAIGRSTEMPTLLRSVDAVFARPGTGTTSEAIACGCPVIFNRIGGAMPQERITLLYARQQSFGATARSGRDVADAVALWMAEPELLEAERAAMRGAAPDASPLDILREIAQRTNALTGQGPG